MSKRLAAVVDSINHGKPCTIKFDNVQALLSRGNIILQNEQLGTKLFTSITSFVQFVHNQKHASKIGLTQLRRVTINDKAYEDVISTLKHNTIAEAETMKESLQNLNLEGSEELLQEEVQTINADAEMISALQNLSSVNSKVKLGASRSSLLDSDKPKTPVLDTFSIELKKNEIPLLNQEVVFIPENSNDYFTVSIAPKESISDAKVYYYVFREENGVFVEKEEIFSKLGINTKPLLLEQVSYQTKISAALIKYLVVVISNGNELSLLQRVQLSLEGIFSISNLKSKSEIMETLSRDGIFVQQYIFVNTSALSGELLFNAGLQHTSMSADNYSRVAEKAVSENRGLIQYYEETATLSKVLMNNYLLVDKILEDTKSIAIANNNTVFEIEIKHLQECKNPRAYCQKAAKLMMKTISKDRILEILQNNNCTSNFVQKLFRAELESKDEQKGPVWILNIDGDGAEVVTALIDMENNFQLAKKDQTDGTDSIYNIFELFCGTGKGVTLALGLRANLNAASYKTEYQKILNDENFDQKYFEASSLAQYFLFKKLSDLQSSSQCFCAINCKTPEDTAVISSYAQKDKPDCELLDIIKECYSNSTTTSSRIAFLEALKLYPKRDIVIVSMGKQENRYENLGSFCYFSINAYNNNETLEKLIQKLNNHTTRKGTCYTHKKLELYHKIKEYYTKYGIDTVAMMQILHAVGINPYFSVAIKSFLQEHEYKTILGLILQHYSFVLNYFDNSYMMLLKERSDLTFDMEYHNIKFRLTKSDVQDQSVLHLGKLCNGIFNIIAIDDDFNIAFEVFEYENVPFWYFYHGLDGYYLFGVFNGDFVDFSKSDFSSNTNTCLQTNDKMIKYDYNSINISFNGKESSHTAVQLDSDTLCLVANLLQTKLNLKPTAIIFATNTINVEQEPPSSTIYGIRIKKTSEYVEEFEFRKRSTVNCQISFPPVQKSTSPTEVFVTEGSLIAAEENGTTLI